METNPICLLKKSCSLSISQKGLKKSQVSISTRVLTCSKKNDFCLLKLNLPVNYDMSPLEHEFNNISKELLTLGFPGDKKDKNDDVVLTYSFGAPIGFMGTGVTSSMFINGGASGSPIIDIKSGKVVGLNSNGSATMAQGTDGMPAVFRLLNLIERSFGITSYLNNAKQVRIEGYLTELRNANDANEAKNLLNKISEEKSFYGEAKLKVLSYSHPKVQVRKSIVKYIDSNLNKNW
jgi:hypothetical protein